MLSVLNCLSSSYNLSLLIRTFSMSLGLPECVGFCLVGLISVFRGFVLFFTLLFLLSELILDC